ncbi:MAG: hypothetical protein OEQ53_14445 [Saprospiraceae bacterium]|nr:hypothetical protein [Saprospiraceae bacterium]
MKNFQFAFCMLFLGTSTALVGQANYDEKHVPHYDLPAVLQNDNGTPVESSEDWINSRRPELHEKFINYVYGYFPSEILDIRFSVQSNDEDALNGVARKKEVQVYFIHEGDTAAMSLLIYLPANAEEPVPLFLGMNFYGNHTIHSDKTIEITPHYVNNNNDLHIFNNKATSRSRGLRASRWPVETILQRGYGLATIYYGDLDPDFDDGFENGIHALLGSTRRSHDMALSAISAWAVGLSAAVDYFESDEAIDHEKIALIGHSRLGKAALWAGASDERFALVISNDSGCGGAALSRRKFGETVKHINERFPHWFCKRFHNYNDREAELPVDQHMLLALMAPRPVYVASAEEDRWADPKGEYLSLVHAGPAYKLFGEITVDQETLPEVNQRRWSGKMGYHIRSGGHDLTAYDWEQYLAFADKHFLR